MMRKEKNWLLMLMRKEKSSLLRPKNSNLMRKLRRKNFLRKKKRQKKNFKILKSNSRHLKPNLRNSSNKYKTKSKSKAHRTIVSLKHLKPQSNLSERQVCMVIILRLIFNGRRRMIWEKWCTTCPPRLLTSDTRHVLIIVNVLERSKWCCRTELHPRWWRQKAKLTQACSPCQSKTTPKSR